jgi:hypothetical protein
MDSHQTLKGIIERSLHRQANYTVQPWSGLARSCLTASAATLERANSAAAAQQPSHQTRIAGEGSGPYDVDEPAHRGSASHAVSCALLYRHGLGHLHVGSHFYMGLRTIAAAAAASSLAAQPSDSSRGRREGVAGAAARTLRRRCLISRPANARVVAAVVHVRSGDRRGCAGQGHVRLFPPQLRAATAAACSEATVGAPPPCDRGGRRCGGPHYGVPALRARLPRPTARGRRAGRHARGLLGQRCHAGGAGQRSHIDELCGADGSA